jgi:hypothetical protein
MTEKTKNAYKISDLMELTGRSRTTIWRMIQRGELPKPDIGAEGPAHPIWFRASLAQHLPNLTTSASN